MTAIHHERFSLKYIGTLLVLALVVVAVAAYQIYVPVGPAAGTTDADAIYIDIAPGTGTQTIAVQLERAGVLRSRYTFDLLRAVKRGKLIAGEYRFNHPASAREVYDRMVRGDIYSIAVSIPEGYNLFDIAQAVANAGLASRKDFLAAVRSQTRLIADLAPNAPSLEGYLFPDTYRFPRHATSAQMLAAMVKRFHQTAAQLNMTHLSPEVLNRTVILASLVEKEVNQDAERPLVASVFTNRLAQDMPLATDPSVIYAAQLAGRYRGTIYASDLQFDSPYNTYRHAGLPPGPIANPGVAALRAALAPAHTNYLYFVADAAGHSRFSATLQQHDQQVASYRRAVNPPPPSPIPAHKRDHPHASPHASSNVRAHSLSR
jgi:UPF0755 protein